MLTPPRRAELCIEHSKTDTATTASMRDTSLWHISLACAKGEGLWVWSRAERGPLTLSQSDEALQQSDRGASRTARVSLSLELIVLGQHTGGEREREGGRGRRIYWF